MMSLVDFGMLRLAEMRVAMTLLTRVPAGRINDPAPSIADACWAFPIAGLVVGAVTALVLVGTLLAGMPKEIAVGLALTASVVTTGGLHEDGLADVADGFGGGHNRDRKLEIMRDSRIGSYGALALILTLGLRWLAMAVVVGDDALLATSATVAIAVASRAGLPVALALLPAARNEGLGRDAARPKWVSVAIALALGLGSVVLLIGSRTALAIAIGQMITILLASWLAFRQIGGQTGDVLGATQQAADLSAWIALVWLLR